MGLKGERKAFLGGLFLGLVGFIGLFRFEGLRLYDSTALRAARTLVGQSGQGEDIAGMQAAGG